MLAGFAAVVAILAMMMQTAPLPSGALRALPADPEAVAAACAGERLPGPVVEAIKAYGAEDLGRAVELLATTAADGVADEFRRAYLGSALARLGRPQEALEALGPETGPALPEPWLGEARWTRAIALRDVGRDEEADQAFEDLAAGAGPVAGRARDVLEPAAE